jgi:anti-anti-sigma factor
MGEDRDKGQPDVRIVPKDLRGCRVLTLQGRLTSDACELFRAAAVDGLRQGVSSLVVDISALETVSSCGIGTLVWIDDDCRKAKCQLQLVNSNPHIERVLSLTGLDHQFRISRSVDEATGKRKDS